MEEQARLSHLRFSKSNKDDVPQWKPDLWPSLLGGRRWFHASVVLNDEEKEQQTVVVIGGQTAKGGTNSVLLMDLEKETKEWTEGPSLNKSRYGHAAVVCNGFVYALGGVCDHQRLDSIERIELLDLLKSPCTNNKHWTILNCKMSTPRYGCQAVAVHSRFIVVAGGYNGSYLSSTDIIDTAVQTQHIVIAGPCMMVPRCTYAMALVGDRIFAIGGSNGISTVNSVEYLEFMKSSSETNADVNIVFPSSSKWKVHKELVLSVPRKLHGVVNVGTSLIVAGGYGDYYLKSVEVLDTKRNVAFKLPDMTVGRDGLSVVSFPDGIAVIGGRCCRDTCETLSLIEIHGSTKTMFSCRAELDMELDKLNDKIQLANRDRSKLKALEEAIEAESLLPVMEWLRDHDDKFRSVQKLKKTIDGLKRKLDDIDGFVGCLPIARKIDELENLVELNVSFGDEKNLVGQKSVVDVESGNETLLVSIRTTDELSSNGCDDPEKQFMKLEDMMIEQRNMIAQLSDRVRLLEKKRSRSIS